MSQRAAGFILLLAIPLCSQQHKRRPSPFPEKNQERDSAPAVAESGTPPGASTRRDRAKATKTSNPSARTTGSVAAGTTGRASFFTSGAAGALTAGGERLDAGKLVAAHATYPLGSLVKVTNLSNGKSVHVRIVDRFPVSKRIINVSEAAARQLDFISAGTAEVRLELVEQNTAPAERE